MPCLGFAAALACALASQPGRGAAASLSPRDLQVLSRTLNFLQAPAPGGEVAVVYAAGDAASRQDAEAIAANLGEGLHATGTVLRPHLVDATALGNGGFSVVITAAGANSPQVSAAVHALRALCVTAALEAVQAGLCTMAIRSEPRVEIVVNHAAASAAGVEFTAAFRMMIREI
jgi:hypothetical protein